MRIEREDRRLRPGGERCVDHPAMSSMDAVEGADRDRPRFVGQVPGPVGDVHEERISSAA
jgi:hypothetical protein